MDYVDRLISTPKIAPLTEFHDQAEFHKDESEKSYRERDKFMPEISEAMQLTIRFLKSSYGKNPKKDTPKAKKPSKP